jgi:hypothetical protein
MAQSTISRFYDLQGLRVQVTANSSKTLMAVHARLRQFLVPEQGAPDLRFELLAVARPQNHLFDQPPEDVRPVYDPPLGQVVYSDAEDRLYIVYGENVRVWCDPAQGRTKVTIVAAALESLWFVSHPLFTLPFVEMMKRRGRYSVHAAALTIDGSGVLLPAGSGAGKSTLALALLRAGFGFLGDDTLFLANEKAGLCVYAFPDEVDATEGTLAFFSELQHLRDRPRAPGAPKWQIRVEEVYGIDFVRRCAPSVLVFPKIANTAKSSLEPMSKDEALMEMAPNILLTEVQSAQAHLDALAKLVQQSSCYRLETGRDFDDLPERLRRLLD